MGRDTECDQRVASISVTQSGPYACVAGATMLMTKCLVLVDQAVAHLRILLPGVVHTPIQFVAKSALDSQSDPFMASRCPSRNSGSEQDR
jgi:hypothetical protein